MISEYLQSDCEDTRVTLLRRLYNLLAPRAYSLIIFMALFCTLAVKLFHAWRYSLLGEYLGWVLLDISFLLIVEVMLALICYRWPKRWILRTTGAPAHRCPPMGKGR